MAYLVTGASSGIGFAVATALATRHNDVIAVARNTAQLKTLRNYSSHIHIAPADLSTEAGRTEVINKTKQGGKIEGIVHAAGSRIPPAAYQDLKADEITADINIHVTAPITLNNALADELTGGQIVYIDSYSASNLRVGWSGYSIVKAAAQMAARSAAEEITKSTVIRVFPGAVQTPLVETLLSAEQNSPTSSMFKELASTGEISSPDIIGEFIANIMINATAQQLEERDIWDFNNPNDQVF